MVIAHLYKDLLNLYGNDGNSKILKNKLEQMGYDVEVAEPTIGSDMDFDKYDVVFVGSGTEGNLKLAIQDLQKHKNAINKAASDGKIILAFGNSVDLFGASGIGLFDYRSKPVNRIKRDVKRKSKFSDVDILGFENHGCVMADENGNELEEQDFIKNNFYGTYIEGPLLVRNPAFLKTIIGKLTNGKIDKLDLSLEEKAYNNFLAILDGGIK